MYPHPLQGASKHRHIEDLFTQLGIAFQLLGLRQEPVGVSNDGVNEPWQRVIAPFQVPRILLKVSEKLEEVADASHLQVHCVDANSKVLLKLEKGAQAIQ